MAKALLFKVLNDTIGKYIDGLTEDNLKLSVFSGTISLQNVALNRKGIEELKLPISVINGFVESINIEIPWTSLESSSVKIFINGVYLLVNPLDFNSYTPEQARKHFHDIKLASLLQEEKKIDLQSQILNSADDIEASAGYFDKLSQKIINNLEISLKNVHIRYEDSTSFPSTCLAIGITLGSFVFTTTDSEWNERYVSNENAGRKVLYKLGKICDLGVYWMTDTVPFDNKSFLQWTQVMKAYVFTSSSSPVGTENYTQLFESASYLLEPPNILRAKCIHQPRSNTNDPKLNVSLESISVSFHADKFQYQQALHLYGVINEGQRRLIMLQHRPTEVSRKGRQRGQQWWRYALILVVNKERLLENKAKTARDCCRHRSEYIALILQEKKAAAALTGGDRAVKQLAQPLSNQQMRSKLEIERLLPLCALVEFHQLASTQYYDELRALRASNVTGGKSPDKKDNKSSWFGSWWGNKKGDTRTEVVSEVTPSSSSIARKEVAAKSAVTSYSVDLAMNSNAATVFLTSSSIPIATLNVACTSNVSYRPTGDLSCTVSVTCLTVRDEVTSQPIMPDLISVASYPVSQDSHNDKSRVDNDVQSDPELHGRFPLAVCFSSHPSKKHSSLNVTSLPLIFCWNPLCLSKLLDMVNVPIYHESLSHEKQMALIRRAKVFKTFQKFRKESLTRRKNQETITQSSESRFHSVSRYNLSESLTVAVDFSAPVLLIPEDSSRDMGCLKVDFGLISAAGSIPTGEDQSGLHSSKASTTRTGEGIEVGKGPVDLGTKASSDCTYICTKIKHISVGFHLSFRDVAKSIVDFEEDGMRRLKKHDDALYIVEPFGVRVDFLIPCVMTRSNYVELADINISCDINPKIEVVLTALTYSRVMHLVNMIQWTLTPPSDIGRVSGGSNVDSQSLAEAALSAVVGANDTIYTLCEDFDDNDEKELANNCIIILHAALPEIKVILIYDEESRNEMSISLSMMTFQFTDRLYDSSVLLNLGGMIISDSSRSESQRTLAHSSREHFEGQSHDWETDELILVSITTFKSSKSPLFTACGNEIDVKMGTISLNIDSNTIMHVRPFYEVAQGKFLIEYPPALPPISDRWVHENPKHLKLINSESTVSPAISSTGLSTGMPNIPAGFQLTLSWDSISLEILKISGTVLSSMDDNVFDLDSVGKMVMRDLTVNVCMEAERASDFEKYVKVSGCDSVTKGFTNVLSADVNMKSLVVTDTRSLSEANLYKTLLCPAQHADESEDFGNSNQICIVFTQESISTFHQVVLEEAIGRPGGPQDVENVETTMSTDVSTDGINVYVSLDAIMELLNATLDVVAAASAVMKPLSVVSNDSEEYDDESDTDDYNGIDDDGDDFYDTRSGPVSNSDLTVSTMQNNDDSSFFTCAGEGGFQDIKVSNAATPPRPGIVVKKKNVRTSSTTSVALPSPRIVFLDDPSSLNSKAMVCRNDIALNLQTRDFSVVEVRFVDEPSTSETTALVEEKIESESSTAVTLAMTDLEALMVPDIARWNPYQILHPTDIRVFVNFRDKHSPSMDSADILGIFHDCDGDAISDGDQDAEKAGSTTSITLEMTDVKVRISLNDLILIQNILLRRTLVETPPSPDYSAIVDKKIPDENDSIQILDLSHYRVSAKLQIVTFDLINDFDIKNKLPIVQCKISDFLLQASGQPFNPSGDGLRGHTTMILQLDAYNAMVAAWEPVVEPWNPEVDFAKLLKAVEIKVETRETCQLTLTSTFLDTFLKTTATLFTQLPDDSYDENEQFEKDTLMSGKETSSSRNETNAPTLTVINNLGITVEIATVGDKTGKVRRLTPSSTSCQLLSEENPRSIGVPKELLSEFDFLNVRLVSDNSKPHFPRMEPLCNLPTMRSSKKFYRLWDVKSTGVVSDKECSSNREVTFDEEVFEYQRYVVGFGRNWKAPFLPTDPHNWSDKRGKRKVSRESVKLPPDGLWEWQGEWRIDMNGQIGQDIDKDGWEYGFDFFELFTRRHANRRVKSRTDCVRRRRWLRTRTSQGGQHAIESSGGVSRPSEAPLFVCWEVFINPDGCRIVTIRSCLQISNKLPYSIMVRLGNDTDESVVNFGPIGVDEVMSVPLLAPSVAAVKMISFRPHNLHNKSWHWSNSVPSTRRDFDGLEEIDAESIEQVAPQSKCAKHNENRAHFYVLRHQDGQSLLWTVNPYLRITNALPCQADIKCGHTLPEEQSARNTQSSTLQTVENVSLFPGNVKSMTQVLIPASASPHCHDVYISLQVPGVGWSDPVHLLARKSLDGNPTGLGVVNELIVEFSFTEVEGESSDFILYGRYLRYQGEACTLEIFSKMIVIDYTGLPLHVSYNQKTQRQDIRDKTIRRSLYTIEESDGSEVQSNMLFNSGRCSPFVSLSDFHVRSRRPYVVQQATVGSRVYSDHLGEGVVGSTLPCYAFVSLPRALHNQQCVHTPSADRNQLLRGSYWMSFRVPDDAFVCVLMDNRLETKVPRWLKKRGYIRTTEKAVAQTIKDDTPNTVTQKDCDFEIYFNIYCQFFEGGAGVNLGTNYSPIISPYQMYSVFVIPAKEKNSINCRLWDQVSTALSPGENQKVDNFWLTDKSGGAMLSDANSMKIGISSSSRNVSWVENSLDVRGVSLSTKGTFTVCNPDTRVVYHLAYQVRQLPGVFSKSKEVAIVPHYCILNTTSSDIRIRQVGNRLKPTLTTKVDAYGSSPWHKIEGHLGTRVQLQSEGTLWSVGSVDINDIGTTTLMLYEGCTGDSPTTYVVLNVEVQFAQAEDKCAVTILIWSSIVGSICRPCETLSSHIPEATESASIAHFSPLALVNQSSASILVQHPLPSSLQQEDTEKNHSVFRLVDAETATRVDSQRRGMVSLPPGTSAVYGWLRPENPNQFLSFSLNLAAGRKVHSDIVSSVNKKIRKKKKRAAASKGPDIIRTHGTECLHVLLDISKIDGTSTGVLYYDASSSSSCDAQDLIVDVVLKVEWSSGGRTVRIIDRQDKKEFAVQVAKNNNMTSEVEGRVDNASFPLDSVSTCNFSMHFFSIGFSLVNDTLTGIGRKELISAHLHDLHFECKSECVDNLNDTGSKLYSTAVILTTADFQVDNYSETVVYPVMFRRDHSAPRAIDKEKALEKSKLPFFRASFVLENSVSGDGLVGQSCYHHADLCLMPFIFEVDTGTLLVLKDFFSNLIKFSKEEAFCFSSPAEWASEYNRAMRLPWQRQGFLLDLAATKTRCLQAKCFYELLQIHPIKASITFVQKFLPKQRKKLIDENGFDRIAALMTSIVEGEFEVHLGSFAVHNALESNLSLFDRVQEKTKADLMSQLVRIVGSLPIFGSPANMMKNIGDGVSDFFYEPSVGMKESPVGFMKGLGKGTSSLMSGVVSGTLYSTATLLNNTAGGMSLLSGDKAYTKQRQVKRLKQKAQRGGAISGLKGGGESVVSGVASGVAGLFTKPVSGAKKDGAAGFIKGLGLGLVGAVVKPIGGVSDGLSTVMNGISNEVSNNKSAICQIRPCRTFTRSTFFPELQLLPIVSVHAAVAQEILRTITREMGGSTDTFVSHVCLSSQNARLDFHLDYDDQGNDNEGASVSSYGEGMRADRITSSTPQLDLGQIILSERCLFLLKRSDYRGFDVSKSRILKDLKWYCVWEQIVRIDAMSGTSSQNESTPHYLRVHLQDDNNKCFVIPCTSRDRLIAAYEAFKNNQYRVHKINRNAKTFESVKQESRTSEDSWINFHIID